jgi:SAM-dependent methyltransferase
MKAMLTDLPNPKQDRLSSRGRAGWYPYYAGFSANFAEAILDRLAGPGKNRVLDPWNGSGTTTAVAAGKGFEGFGFDLNPVMAVVARARLLNKRDRPSLRPLAKLFAENRPRGSGDVTLDPLTLWFKPAAVERIRRLEYGLQKALFDLPEWVPMHQHIVKNEFSDLAAFFYLALFRTVRQLLAPFQCSNPTWMKASPSKAARISPSDDKICSGFFQQIETMVGALDDDRFDNDSKIKIGIAASQSVPLSAESVDFVLSSPPYCTRIDYVSATRAELAILGIVNDSEIDSLRRALLGTPTVPKEAPEWHAGWGDTSNRFLQKVREHPSKASAGYYYKGHCQYFHGIYDSMRELHRCLANSGRACLVVQDSPYKDVHNDLPTIFTEMASALNMRLEARRDFILSRSMGQVNSMSRRYRTSGSAVESVLVFTKN